MANWQPTSSSKKLHSNNKQNPNKMRIQYSYFCTTITGSCSATTARCHLSLSSMKLSRSLLRPSFFRRRNAAFRRSPFFSRKRGAAAADNPEPSSPKVTCIGQVRVQSQKKVKQCRRRIGEASFRSTDQQPPPPRWVHLPNITLLLRAFGHELCCWFHCRCCCGATREREKEREREREREREIKYADENGCGALLGRWLVAEGGRRREIEVVVGGGGGDEEIMSAGNSRRHVFDDIEVKGDRIEVKGRSGEGETTRFSICIPPKNALLLMRCRSDPLKMAAIANRISSDAAKYGYGGIEEKQQEEESYDESTSSEEFLEGEHKVYVAQVLEKREMRNVEDCGDKLVIINEQKVEEIEQELNEEEEEKEETESNMSSFEALLDQENTEQDQDFAEVEEAKSDVDKASAHIEPNEDATIVQEEQNAVQPDKLEPEMPEHQETATKKETATTAAAAALPECLLLMMREPKLSMEVSKETWVCATDFIRLLPERPRRAAAKAAATGGGGGDHHEPVVKRRSTVEKSRPRVPAPPGKRNDVQPARSSCSLPAASTAAVIERKRANGGAACEPLALTRCKSEPMSTAAAKLMPEPGCWKDNVEPHRQASVGVGAAGVGF